MPEQNQVQAHAMLALLGRMAVAILFIISGVGKLTAPETMIDYIASAGLPFAPFGLVIAMTVEIGFSILLIIGLFTRAVAAVMAVFTISTAIFFHANFADQNMFIHFLKNVSVAGGLLQIVAFGAGRLSLDARRAAQRK